MRDIIIISPHEYGIEKIKYNLPSGVSSVFSGEEERLTVNFKNSENQIEFKLDNSLRIHYEEPEEIEVLANLGSSLNFIIVHFKDISQLKTLLTALSDLDSVLIDNDFDALETGVDFVAHWRDDPSWDWVEI
jgi:hypothetical protein